MSIERLEPILKIRVETENDIEAIFALNKSAFETDEEARIVDTLRKRGKLTLSLVALEEDKIVGHIAFSPMSFGSADNNSRIVALAPMAVAPSKQKTGIGSKLIKEGLRILKERGFEGVLLVGHPDYYPKFGFKPAASTFGLKCAFEVPDEAFLGLELGADGFSKLKGAAHFSEEFSSN
ncbi:MAG: GNAT family N-acetyltransferase [Bdellovibrionales bacterium]